MSGSLEILCRVGNGIGVPTRHYHVPVPMFFMISHILPKPRQRILFPMKSIFCIEKTLFLCFGSHMGKNFYLHISCRKRFCPSPIDVFCIKNMKRQQIIFLSIVQKQGFCGSFYLTFWCIMGYPFLSSRYSIGLKLTFCRKKFGKGDFYVSFGWLWKDCIAS